MRLLYSTKDGFVVAQFTRLLYSTKDGFVVAQFIAPLTRNKRRVKSQFTRLLHKTKEAFVVAQFIAPLTRNKRRVKSQFTRLLHKTKEAFVVAQFIAPLTRNKIHASLTQNKNGDRQFFMSHYEYYLIFLACIFCGYACYTDLKTQKIRNICSFGLLYAGILSQLMAWYLGATTPLYILGLFFGSGIAAFAFYWFGIFSPGDSKLFWGLCLIFPSPLFRTLSGTLSFPPLILALNIIIPYAIGVLGYLLFKFLFFQNKLTILRHFFTAIFQKERLFKQIFNLFLLIGIGSAITYISQLFEWEINRILQVILVLTTFTLIQKLLSRLPKTPVYYTVIGFVCVWLSLKANSSIIVFLSSFAFFLGLYIVIFVIAKQLILGLATVTLDKDIDIANLKVGMIPAEQIVQALQQDGVIRYEKQQVTFSSGLTGNIVISPSATGLSKEEIAELKNLADQGAFVEFENKIKIQPDICFAPVISIGVLLTILCQGPFYLKLIQIF